MTDYLDEIQARADAATPGPWEFEGSDLEWEMWHEPFDADGFYVHVVDGDPDYPPLTVADGRFIAHARTDVPRLVAAIRAVEALADAGDEAAANATRGYPEGQADPGPPPAWVWAADIRDAIRDALEPT